MSNLNKDLSLEQQFNLKVFADRVSKLSREEAQELLVELYQQMLYKDNIYKKLFLSQEKEISELLAESLKGITH
ncbi:MAG: phycobilisome degradation protein nblA [Cyanobacteria bacterium J083]|nr:MAG: phycobilisome degradation protein nblA [Cyanobacteria bacterium J083]